MARILIAEDEEGGRSLVARALTLDGHEVITANDGAAALEVLTPSEGAFELLLHDIRMPVMDGTRWRSRPPAIIRASPFC